MKDDFAFHVLKQLCHYDIQNEIACTVRATYCTVRTVPIGSMLIQNKISIIIDSVIG